MTDPVLLLDSTVLVAYERELTRRAQAVVLEALAEGRLMVPRPQGLRSTDPRRVAVYFTNTAASPRRPTSTAYRPPGSNPATDPADSGVTGAYDRSASPS